MKSLAAVVVVLVLTGAAAGSAQVRKSTERRFHVDKLTPGNPAPGVKSRRVFGETVAITLVTIDKGASTPRHSHPDEQLMIMNTGRGRLFVEDREHDLGPGDIIVIPSHLEHHLEALEPATWTEVHGPGFHNNPNFAKQILQEIESRGR